MNGIDDVQIVPPASQSGASILSPEAVEFVTELVREFRPRVNDQLAARAARRKAWASGTRLGFLLETKHVRDGDWRAAPLPHDLEDRRVEITGPVDRKMVINALNSGANCYMADFEDSNSPTWSNCVEGQANLRDAVFGTISFEDRGRNKSYRLNDDPAVLFVRPRGWHLQEKHFVVDDRPCPASLCDFGLFFFHNARKLVESGSGPYFYLPKLESHLEARLWNEVFVRAQERLGLPRGTIKATVLIETLPAAFEMDEILFELREHSAGLNCGRWDYIFSYIKVHSHDPTRICPDRGEVGMSQHFMKSYASLVVQTCHRRGVHAMGGMAAQIPIKHDPEANEAALAKVREDKLREVQAGHDGTWVAHPGLVSIARDVFDAHMPKKNQIDRTRDDIRITERDLLEPPEGHRTESALRHNLRVGVQYIEAWLRGNGCVPLYSLMEDAATAEISRMQVWQWVTHRATLDDGSVVSRDFVRALLSEEMDTIRAEVGEDRFLTGEFVPRRVPLFRTRDKRSAHRVPHHSRVRAPEARRITSRPSSRP